MMMMHDEGGIYVYTLSSVINYCLVSNHLRLLFQMLLGTTAGILIYGRHTQISGQILGFRTDVWPDS